MPTNSAPNIPPLTSNSSVIDAVTGTDRATARGTIGCGARRSCATNTAATPAAATSPSSVGAAPHPCAGTPASVCTSTASAATSRAAPVASSRRASSREGAGARTRRAAAAIATATGTLSTNTARQPRCSTSAPPRTGPAPAATPIALVRRAIGRRSRSGGYVSLSSASVAGCSSAPKTPCATRRAITQPTPGASAMPAEAAAKPSRPRKSSRGWPYRSPRRPATTSSAATASR